MQMQANHDLNVGTQNIHSTFIDSSRSTMYLALTYFIKVTGRHIPLPKIIAYSDSSNLMTGYFDPGSPSEIFLNSAHSGLRNPVVHEFVHFSRYHLLGNEYPNSLKAQLSTLRIEEACASFGDAAFYARKEEDAKGKIINILNSMYARGSNNVDVFGAALAVLDYYEDWKTKKEAIESIVGGHGKHKPYVIDAGFALVMFAAKGFDEKTLLKDALTLPTLKIWKEIDAALALDLAGIKEKIETLRKEYR